MVSRVLLEPMPHTHGCPFSAEKRRAGSMPNNLLPGERHITVAWGRDFSDVSPLRGVTSGAGGQRLSVAVDVIPAEE